MPVIADDAMTSSIGVDAPTATRKVIKTKAGTRASMNGQVPADQTYDGFLRKQPKAFQDEVLGKTKADLFRSGVKVDRFTDASGVEYTLDQLKRREREAWQTATA